MCSSAASSRGAAVRTAIALCCAIASLAGCEDAGAGLDPMPPDTMPPDTTPPGLRMTRVATGLSSPVLLTAPAGDPRSFVVEQTGHVRILSNGAVLPTPFLDITDRVVGGGERGLLGLAFHPDYASNGFFYVHYTGAGGASRIARFSVTGDPDIADPSSELLILEVPQPASNHNAGMLEFAPDGTLFIAMGDGGGSGDPQGNGQNTTTLLGAMLRVDVDGGTPYAIPPDNPFPTSGPDRAEIWAWGLRNPWRFSIDPVGAHIWIGDVGQDRAEEINRRPLNDAGVNYGWNVTEGTSCFGSTTCNRTGLAPPLVEVLHPDGCSIIGGYVYRGTGSPELEGLYFYSDFCAGYVRSVPANANNPTPVSWRTPDLGQVLSFGRDGAGELYVLNARGEIWSIDGDVK